MPDTKKKIIYLACTMLAFQAVGQTNQNVLDSVEWRSQSKTVQVYRQQYPQLAKLTDERLVPAIGNKFPQLLKTDSVFSNEFRALNPSDGAAVRPEPKDQITTRQNEVYDGVKILKVDPDGLTISYTNSTKAILWKKIGFENLPDAVQQKYHYDRQAAADYRARQQQGMADLQEQLRADGRIATLVENERIDEGLQQRRIEEAERIDAQMAEAAQKEAEARQKAADAAMIAALQPPQQINIEQNTTVY